MVIIRQEPFIVHEYEFRIQVIGKYVRCFRRNSDSGWKNNWGNVKFEEHPWDPKYEIWIDEIRKVIFKYLSHLRYFKVWICLLSMFFTLKKVMIISSN